MSVPKELIEGLKTRYSEPQRHYHTWEHVGALLRHWEAFRSQMNEPELVLWALYYHDAIYDPQAPDNEEKSAELFCVEAAPQLSPDQVAFVNDIIIGTKSHQLTGEWTGSRRDDMALFLDLDLSIFAAPKPVFDTYEQNVRKEYAFVPLEKFRAGRAAILKRFLDRDRIYFSAQCFEIWEEPARANLEKSIAALEGT